MPVLASKKPRGSFMRNFGIPLGNRTAPSGLSVPSGPRGANATRANVIHLAALAPGSRSTGSGCSETRSRGPECRKDRVSFPPLPSGSIAGCAPLERGNALQTVFDCLAVLAAFLLVSVTGIGIAAAFWILLFVKL